MGVNKQRDFLELTMLIFLLKIFFLRLQGSGFVKQLDSCYRLRHEGVERNYISKIGMKLYVL